jgi:hypothetical protein
VFSRVSSKLSKASSGNRSNRPGCSNSSEGGQAESDNDSEGPDQGMEAVVGLGMRQKIEALKMRRRSDRIHVILTAAARGDLNAMKAAFRVRSTKH